MTIGKFLEKISDGEIAIVQEAIKDHLDLNMQDSRGRTALMEAANFGYVEIVELLLRNGADPNIQYSQGQTALSDVFFNWGESEKGLSIAKLLRAYGADYGIKMSEGKTIAEYAKEKNYEKILGILNNTIS